MSPIAQAHIDARTAYLAAVAAADHAAIIDTAAAYRAAYADLPAARKSVLGSWERQQAEDSEYRAADAARAMTATCAPAMAPGVARALRGED